MVEPTSNNEPMPDSQMAEDPKPAEEVAPVEEKKPEGEPLTAHVNQDFAEMLKAMGYSRVVAEKALFLSKMEAGGVESVEAAMGWIEKHQDDADLEEEAFLVFEQGAKKSNLSPAEAQAAAQKLQEQLR